MTLLTLLTQRPSQPPPQASGTLQGRPRKNGNGPLVSLIAAIIVVTIAGVAYAWCGPSGPIIPWAEENQGLLSLLALVIALLFAVFENRRALRADDVARREYVDMLLELIDELRGVASSAPITAAAANPDALQTAWVREAQPFRQAVATAKHVILRDALLLVEVHRLDHVLSHDIRRQSETGISTAEQMLARLDSIRASVLARR
jgi:hypothetical protein